MQQDRDLAATLVHLFARAGVLSAVVEADGEQSLGERGRWWMNDSLSVVWSTRELRRIQTHADMLNGLPVSSDRTCGPGVLAHRVSCVYVSLIRWEPRTHSMSASKESEITL